MPLTEADGKWTPALQTKLYSWLDEQGKKEEEAQYLQDRLDTTATAEIFIRRNRNRKPGEIPTPMQCRATIVEMSNYYQRIAKKVRQGCNRNPVHLTNFQQKTLETLPYLSQAREEAFELKQERSLFSDNCKKTFHWITKIVVSSNGECEIAKTSFSFIDKADIYEELHHISDDGEDKLDCFTLDAIKEAKVIINKFLNTHTETKK